MLCGPPRAEERAQHFVWHAPGLAMNLDHLQRTGGHDTQQIRLQNGPRIRDATRHIKG
eukprot:CAMPEP_0204384216 /NCGR_PEP_ID=MMETSP0469-20131031/56682_1 /ASSEMBLY_ACC=CAM_ASM_000384 /TAXON_ID=2969 /ORGANISM="Oxyrrhis marina" /LENGTH=57 /DNA_ID=CAMNT_0051376781 /DNA_START=36 /DNA_END=205 /DNA_ORIENTATION=-